MSTDGKKLGIAIVCVDWRLHQKEVRIAEKVRDALGVDVVDVVAFPGPDGIVESQRSGDSAALLSWLELLIDAHHPVAIALVGHYNCAANACDDTKHDSDAKKTTEYLKTESKFENIRGFSAVRNSDTDWDLKEL